jgi:hypothetical protein
MFDAFDPPEVMTSCPRRFETTVPTQALALLNSAVAQDQARQFAHRLNQECAGKLDKIPARAWLLAFGRPITAAEHRKVSEFIRKREAAIKEAGKCNGSSPTNAIEVQQAKAASTNQSAPASLEPTMEPGVEAALTEFCLALFNANEFVFID